MGRSKKQSDSTSSAESADLSDSTDSTDSSSTDSKRTSRRPVAKPKAKPKTEAKPKAKPKAAKPKAKPKTKPNAKPSTTKAKGSNATPIKDLQKIIDDPVSYAKSVTVDRLVVILKKLSEYYYIKTEPLVDDDTFDLMVEVLTERDSNNAFLFQTGAPTTARDDVKLPYGMPSLDKIKPGEKSLMTFFKKYHEPFEKKSTISYVIDDKLDGVSGLLHKNANGVVDMFSKSQTLVGKSKKHLIKYLFKQSVLDAMPNDTAIRFEILISRQDFKEFEDRFKNPRNTVAGFVNTDKIDSRLAAKMQAVTYGILYPRMTYSDQLTKLKEWGFKVVWNRELNSRDLDAGLYDADPDNKYAGAVPVKAGDEEDSDDSDIEGVADLDPYQRMEIKLEQILKYRRAESEFDCDGIVVVDNSKTYVYDNEKNPTYSVAFKKNIQSDMKDVKVVEVIWEPSMYGVLKPVIRIEPVKISGVTVTYVTGHNASNIRDNLIGPGSVVRISRSGDVIPYIEEVLIKTTASMPSMAYEWNETGIDIVAVEPDQVTKDKIQIKRNLHFFRTLGVKFLSEGLMKLVYDNGYTSIASIVEAAYDKDDAMSEIQGLGSKMISKIYAEIDKALKSPDLPKLMSGSLMFGMGMGVRKLKELVKHVPNILSLKSPASKILEVPGFSNVSSTKVSNGIPEFNRFVETLRNTGYALEFDKTTAVQSKSTKSTKSTKTQTDTDTTSSNEKSKNDLSNKTVVLTGFRDKSIEEFVEDSGGKIGSSVSSRTNLVVYVETTSKSAKLQKAEDLGISMMTREEFIAKYM